MNRLFVWVRMPDGILRMAGELTTTTPVANSGRFESEFQYTPDWSQGKSSFPLDPRSLPLKTESRRFNAELFNPPLSVFDDALPDDWGRRLLAAALKIEGRRSTPAGRQQSSGRGAAQSPVHNAAGEWLAKFPSTTRDGSHDVIGLEAVCLELARRAGLEVPEFQLEEIGRRRVLLVRRFDVTQQNGRLHMVSLRTLCLERPGVYVHGYSDLARVIRKHSAAPDSDIATLFRHMTFNAAVGNVDDHLKNFWMLAEPKGYRLAPAFDLVPDTTGRGEHTLSFKSSFACPTGDELMALADDWGVDDAAEITSQVIKAVRNFAATARKFAVRGSDSLETISADIRKRLETIAPVKS